MLVLIPPLLVGSDSGGCLRKDMRRGVDMHFLTEHGARKIEDKLLACKVELRPFTLNLNLDDLHRNRGLPAAFICYLGVPDCSLPLKGTAHRAVRGTPEAEKATNVLLVRYIKI